MLVLASNSPRRKQLMTLAGWSFRVSPANVDETPLAGESPTEHVLRLAGEKARAAALISPAGSLIIAADTTVADGDTILGKPADAQEAADTLHRLQGRSHKVHTAIAVYDPQQDRLLTDLCTTDVRMRQYSRAEISAYVATGDPLDKAGSYAIQHRQFDPVESLDGCFANVVGLPLCRLARLLYQFNQAPESTAAVHYTSGLETDCQVNPTMLWEDV